MKIRLVEGISGSDATQFARPERLLNFALFIRGEVGMIALRRKLLLSKELRHAFGGVPSRAINDGP